MQDKTPRDRRATYTGRFAGPGEAMPGREFANARSEAGDAQPRPARTTSRPAGAQSSGTDARSRFAGAQSRTASAGTQPQRRPSGFAMPEAAKRTASSTSQAGKADEAPEEKSKRFKLFSRKSKEERGGKSPAKRSRAKKLGWKKKLLIALGALLALFLLFVLIFGRGGGTYHQLPRIERGSNSAYEPEQGAVSGGEASDANASGEAEYLVNPGAADEGSDGEDLSKYLVTPEPGVDLSQAAAAAGAELDAATGADGADSEEGS